MTTVSPSSRTPLTAQPDAPVAAPTPAPAAPAAAAPAVAPVPAPVDPQVALAAREGFAADASAQAIRAQVEAPAPAADPAMLAFLAQGHAPTAPDAKLRQGARGPEVAQLQEALASLGYDVGPADGWMGPKTAAAVKAFQRDHGLKVDGYYGPKSAAALRNVLSQRAGAPAEQPPPAPAAPPAEPSAPAEPAAAAPSLPVPQGALRKGSSGPEVAQLQGALASLGYSVGPVDGKFGPMTEAGLKAFQRDRGITVDGTYGPQSRGALTAALGGAPAAGPVGGSVGPHEAGRVGPMLDWAKSMIGSKYAAVNPFRFGEVLWDGKPHQSVNGSGTVWNYPKGTRVFDCSGFVVTAYKQLGVDLAARGLTSSREMARDTRFLKDIRREDLQPGDLITYAPKNGVGHVVIYLGDGKTIEAAGGSGVKIGTVDWDRANAYKRVPLP